MFYDRLGKFAINNCFNNKMHVDFPDWDTRTSNRTGCYCGIPLSVFVAPGPLLKTRPAQRPLLGIPTCSLMPSVQSPSEEAESMMRKELTGLE